MIRGSIERTWLVRAWTPWQVLALGVIVFVPPFLHYGQPLWTLSDTLQLHVLGLGAAHLISVAIVTWFLLRSPDVPLVTALSVTGVCLAGFYLSLLMFESVPYSRAVILSGSGMSATCIAVPILWLRFRIVSLLLLVAGGSGGLAIATVGSDGAGAGDPGHAARPSPHVQDSVVYSAYHPVRARSYSNYLPRPTVSGGGLQPVHDRFLLVTGDGTFYRAGWSRSPDSLAVTELPPRAPINSAAFDRDVPDYVTTRWFRVLDLLVDTTGGRDRILVTHHYWKSREKCFVLRLSVLDWSPTEWDALDESSGWRTLFESQPCLPIKERARGLPFGGLMAGGRLASLGDGRVLVTVGDHQYDGWNSDRALPQHADNHYGKVVLLDSNGSAELFSLGHRNPQGLHVAPDGRVWLTEHGPEGGDELNRLTRGGNYGWPFATAGTDYGDWTWPLNGKEPDGRRFIPPVYSWVPSIGVSNLLVVRDSVFRRWRGDHLVASLKAETLYRMEVENERVKYVEPIPVGYRVRDLVEDPEGRIVLWTDGGDLVVLTPAKLKKTGAALFMKHCQSCHTLDDRRAPGLGPDLRGVYKRRIAWMEDFEYSTALEDLVGVWTDDRLDKFLADPDSFAPGTSMDFEGMADASDRRALIEYLKSLRP